MGIPAHIKALILPITVAGIIPAIILWFDRSPGLGWSLHFFTEALCHRGRNIGYRFRFEFAGMDYQNVSRYRQRDFGSLGCNEEIGYRRPLQICAEPHDFRSTNSDSRGGYSSRIYLARSLFCLEFCDQSLLLPLLGRTPANQTLQKGVSGL